MKPYWEVRTFCGLPKGAVHKMVDDHGIEHLAVKVSDYVRQIMHIDPLTGWHRFELDSMPVLRARELVWTEVVRK